MSEITEYETETEMNFLAMAFNASTASNLKKQSDF